MNKIRHLILATLAAVSTAHAMAADYAGEAMPLAIAHFNARHDKDIRSWGAEHSFMVDVLKAVGGAVPELATVGARAQLSTAGFDDPYRFLKADVFVAAVRPGEKTHLFDRKNNPEANRKRADALKAEVSRVVEGCPYQKTTVVEETQRAKYAKTTAETIIYTLEPTRGRQCAQTELTRALAELGLNQIVVKERVAAYGTNLSVYLGRNTNLWRDMAYVKAQALQIDAAKPLVEMLDIVGEGVRIGRSSEISLAGKTGGASFSDPVRLRYTQGWGDCPAGCINRHTWDVTVTPTHKAEGKYEFKVEVTGERGNALPSRKKAVGLKGRAQ